MSYPSGRVAAGVQIANGNGARATRRKTFNSGAFRTISKRFRTRVLAAIITGEPLSTVGGTRPARNNLVAQVEGAANSLANSSADEGKYNCRGRRPPFTIADAFITFLFGARWFFSAIGNPSAAVADVSSPSSPVMYIHWDGRSRTKTPGDVPVEKSFSTRRRLSVVV